MFDPPEGAALRDQPDDPNRRDKVMWAVLHVPSGSWHQGDSKLELYPFDYVARYACPSDSFRPVKVVVSLYDKS